MESRISSYVEMNSVPSRQMRPELTRSSQAENLDKSNKFNFPRISTYLHCIFISIIIVPRKPQVCVSINNERPRIEGPDRGHWLVGGITSRPSCKLGGNLMIDVRHARIFQHVRTNV